MSELRTDSREWVHRIMGSLDRMLVGIENLAVGNRPVLGGERYLTDKEVSAQLKLSRRTLQDYRNEGDDKDRVTAPDSVEYVTNPPLLRYQNTLFYQIFYIACCCIW